MIESFLTNGMLIGIAMFVFGLSQYFSVSWGDKWLPGLNVVLIKFLSDNYAGKFMLWGISLFIICAITGAVMGFDFIVK